MKRASIREIVEHPKPNEYYVLVTRHYPPYLRFKGLKLTDTAISEWDKDLAPSAELIKDYKENKITWKEYTERFKKEIPLALAKRKFQIHQENAKGKEVVLVCIEEDWQRPECHTWILLDMYREGV